MVFSNNIVHLTNAHTGKVVHHLDCTADSDSPVCCLGWGINSVSGHKVEHGKNISGPEEALDDLLGQGRKHASDSPPDLPKDLAFLDVEAMLPRLSSLAFTGVE